MFDVYNDAQQMQIAFWNGIKKGFEQALWIILSLKLAGNYSEIRVQQDELNLEIPIFSCFNY